MNTEKNRYIKPSLTWFGPVATLTQNGSKVGAEETDPSGQGTGNPRNCGAANEACGGHHS